MPDYEFLLDNETVDCSVEKHERGYVVRVDEQSVDVKQVEPGQYAVTFNGERKIVAAAFDKGVWYVDVDSAQLELREPDEEGFGGGAADQSAEKDKVFAPMPGKIVKVLVAVGDEVEEKQPLVIVEAMKMENQVNSAAKGKVKAINFQAGEQVDTETPLIELEVEELA